MATAVGVPAVQTKRKSRVKGRRAAFAVERLRFRRAPLAAAAVWLAVGLCMAKMAYEPTLVMVVALGALLGLSVWAMLRAERVAWVPVAAVWVVVGMCAAEWQRGPDLGMVPAYADGLSRRVRGRVERVRVLPGRVAAAGEVDKAEVWGEGEETVDEGGAAVSVDLVLEEVERVTPDLAEMVKGSGGVRVTVYGPGVPLACGDRVEGELRLRGVDRYRDPGAWQAADYLAEQGIGARASVQGAVLRRIGGGDGGIRCRLGAAQAWASGRLGRFVDSGVNRGLPAVARLNGADARMLDAMLFGDRTGLDHALRTGFERTGTFHLFVVSGLHIALLSGAVFWGLRRVGMPTWAATVGTIAAAAGYAALTGFGQPAQRSLGMVSVFLVARLLGRERESLQALGAAALAMLLWAPASLFEAGFQMTVLAVVAIAGIGHPLAERWFVGYGRAARDVFRPRRGQVGARLGQVRLTLEMMGEEVAIACTGRAGSWVRRLPAACVRVGVWAAELALLGTVTELVMALPMAMYFHRAAVFALPANMVVLPVIAVLAPAAVATFVGSLVSPWVAAVPGAVTAVLLHGISGAIAGLSGLAAADWRVPGPGWGVAVAVLGVLGGCCWAVRRGAWGALAAAAAVALPFVAVLVLWPRAVVRTAGALEVTALDVGQGDSLLVVGPEGRTMLVDAGGPIGAHGQAEVVAGFDVGEEVVSPYLWSRGVRRLDVAVLTHAHTDHMGGMAAILENFRPRELWVGVDARSPQYEKLVAEAGRLMVNVRHFAADDALRWDGVDVYALSPRTGYANGGAPKNDDSLVLRMQYGRSSVLLEGDAERPSEEAMVAAGLGPVTLLKVGHHGSRTSSTQGFVDAAAPQDAVVSVGRHNSFGHPRGEVIERLAGAGTHLFRTDEMGLATFLLTPDGRVRERVGEGLLPDRLRFQDAASAKLTGESR